MNTNISKLKVGQRFSFIPAEWYGPGMLTKKKLNNMGTYDIEYDARVVNPPAIIYGIDGKTRVRICSNLKRKP